ncbi:hypothetical protein PAP_00530 [Palaeococcus pacificus DY20341]|uniref:Uncharacterized protein n=1 Tax=Palaeococcus pacificus DY20341 TaxID=1343739 RepID=A0A075LRF3_9EURY|nr:hypothetical protein [Palaeococcus pacificus]AIF68552.1 hypothetical protein PAP_00530 [Palaeococcus pacificus DY20341]
MDYSKEGAILEEILKEGVYWAFMGRPFEVLPFLRGKLLSEVEKLNGKSKNAGAEVEHLLKELEELYKSISASSKIHDEQVKLVLSYRGKLLKCLKS